MSHSQDDKAIFILGLGFLGASLFQRLQLHSWQITGSRRQCGAEANVVALNIDAVEHAPATMRALLAAEALVCLLPPASSSDYAGNIMRLVGLMQAQGRLKQVVLASSTSVYGNEVRMCTEATPTAATTASAQAIVALEQALNQSAVAQVSILRFGGLFGPDRHPVTVLAQKKAIQGAEQPVNVVSQGDAVNAIVQVLRKPLAARQLYNICHPAHPSKQVFYQHEATQRGLGILAFVANGHSRGKVIDGHAYLKDYGQVMEDLI